MENYEILNKLRYKETRWGEEPRSIEEQISFLQNAFAKLCIKLKLNEQEMADILNDF